MTDRTNRIQTVSDEKLRGGGDSQGGAYPRPHEDEEADKPGPDDFMGHGGQSRMGYHGTGQLGDEPVGSRGNANAPAKSD